MNGKENGIDATREPFSGVSFRIGRDSRKLLLRIPVFFIAGLVSVFVCLCSIGCVAEADDMLEVGVLVGLGFLMELAESMVSGLEELGYVEGEDIAYDIRISEFDTAEYDRILREFVEDGVDLIVSMPTEASMLAKEIASGTEIPVLFSYALLENSGLVESIAEPGGNVTGVRYPGPDIVRQRVEIMRELKPDAESFLVPYQRGYPNTQIQIATIVPMAEDSGIELSFVPAADEEELRFRLEELGEEAGDVDAVLFLAEPLGVTPEPFTVIGEFASERAIPIGGALLEAGGYRSVFGLNVDKAVCGMQTARLADKIFSGIPAGSIPVVSAENYLSINSSEAEKLGLEVPMRLLNRADYVLR